MIGLDWANRGFTFDTPADSCKGRIALINKFDFWRGAWHVWTFPAAPQLSFCWYELSLNYARSYQMDTFFEANSMKSIVLARKWIPTSAENSTRHTAGTRALTQETEYQAKCFNRYLQELSRSLAEQSERINPVNQTTCFRTNSQLTVGSSDQNRTDSRVNHISILSPGKCCWCSIGIDKIRFELGGMSNSVRNICRMIAKHQTKKATNTPLSKGTNDSLTLTLPLPFHQTSVILESLTHFLEPNQITTTEKHLTAAAYSSSQRKRLHSDQHLISSFSKWQQAATNARKPVGRHTHTHSVRLLWFSAQPLQFAKANAIQKINL